MTELNGALDGLGLPAIVRFLASLNMTGWLRVVHDDWRGELFLDNGRVVAAAFGSRRGMRAIEAIVQVLPEGQFTFTTATIGLAEAERNIDLSPDELLAWLDDLAAGRANGAPRLPSLEAVPEMVSQEDVGDADQVRLDRGTLQTLLAVDGRRTVQQIISARGSFETLWQLGALAEVGLVHIPGLDRGIADTADADIADAADRAVGEVTTSEPTVPTVAPESMPVKASVPAAAPEPRLGKSTIPAAAAESAPVKPKVPTAAPEFTPVEPSVPAFRPESTSVEPSVPAAAASVPPVKVEVPSLAPIAPSKVGGCPKLGFEDDPSHSVARPTRLHRCFALGTPLSVPMDQQRELCLSDQFGTCPRLAAAAPHAEDAPDADHRLSALVPLAELTRPEPERPHRSSAAAFSAPIAPASAAQPASDAHAALATSARATLAQPGAAAAASAAHPQDSRAAAASTTAMPRTGSATPSSGRGSMVAAATTLSPATAGAGAGAAAAVGNVFPPMGQLEPFGGGRPRLATIGALAMGVAVVALLLVPRLLDTTADVPSPAALFRAPQTEATATVAPPPSALGQTTDAGANARTAPVNDQLSRAQITAAQTSAGQAAGDQSLATQPGAASAAGTQSLAAQTSGASAAGAQPAATPLSATRVAGAVAASAGQDRGQAAAPAAAATGASSAPRVLLDERFADNAHGWTNDSNGPATFSSGSYRLNARLPGQFVALGTPITDTLRDVVVGATFRKLSGPAGGGFGLIVRDQGPEPRDGVSQGGRYYVLEVGDKGEIGMWRRDSDRWIDLLPWQHSDAVRTGTESNQIVARAVGDQLSLEVNGTQVGSVIDSTLAAGRVGLFVGGDQNQISVDHLWVQAP